MLLVGVLTALCAVTLSIPAPERCEVSGWGEWNECTKGCIDQNVHSQPQSDADKALGIGRKNMKTLIGLKSKAYAERLRCKNDPTCYQASKPSITGALVECVDGMAGDYPCNNVDLLSFVSHEDLGYPGAVGNDIWVWFDEDNSDYYAIMGVNEGTSFVRVTDPVNPEVVGILRTHTSSSTWRDMKVVGNYAFIVSEATGHGMQVFDLTQLRGLNADSTREFENTAHYGRVSNTHNIACHPSTETCFLVGSTRNSDCDGNGQGGTGGLHMVDVSDPENPSFSGCFESDGYVHDVECLIYSGPDTRYTGNEICFGYNEDSLTIYDVTDKTQEILLSRVTYTGVRYSHQGWCTEDQRYLLLDDELDEAYSSDKYTKTYVWDIQDLTDPQLLYTYRSSEESIDHNLYIRGNYAHQSNYEAGYRILDLSNIETELTEVGYFDVYPSRTTANFEGTWSNYPWCEDAEGNQFTVLSSINYGLFVLRPNWDAIQTTKSAKNMSLNGEMSRFREVVYATPESKCPALVETKTCAATC